MTEFKQDARLEDLSAKVQLGIPIEPKEALEVLNYQDAKEAHRKENQPNTWFGRIMRYFGAFSE
jgi:hypothetical protein